MKNFSQVRLGDTDDLKYAYEKEAKKQLVLKTTASDMKFHPASHPFSQKIVVL